jgi:hypothetical protein
MFLKEHADVRAKLEAKLLPLLGLRPAVLESAVPAAAGEVLEKPAPPSSAAPVARAGAAAPHSESARRR